MLIFPLANDFYDFNTLCFESKTTIAFKNVQNDSVLTVH